LVLPIILTASTPVGLAGEGDALQRRRQTIEQAGLKWQPVSLCASPEDLIGLGALFVAGLPRREADQLARAAREAGVLVNVEDEPGLCDFFVPAVVRRGDLLIAISTSGRAPGLAKLVRQWIERRLGAEWAERLSEVSSKRLGWRRGGASMPEVAARTASFVEQRGWLP
jgi:precorrin-2 dehydrogenase/sirohydrochlorin ferrochelatase